MNIFVSNLDFQTTAEDITGIFTKFGKVSSVKIIVDKITNLPRGFAYVEMPSNMEANAAIASLNKKNVKGKLLNVSVARTI